MVDGQLHQLIKGCIEQDRKCQKLLYKQFYGFSMGICMRYTGNRDEAVEVMNQGFLKVFTHLEKFDTAKPFKAWLGRIMMNASIDHYRANLKMAYMDDLDKAEDIGHDDLPDQKLSYDELLAMVQRLPQGYRTVFNLFAIEGYGHEEIADMLGISTGTSKSNLFKARAKLRDMIKEADDFYKTSGGRLVNYSTVAMVHMPNADDDKKKGFWI